MRRPTGRQLLRLLPLLDLLLVVVADLSLRRVVLLGLLSTVPLLAASVCAPRTTALYGAAAVGFAAGGSAFSTGSTCQVPTWRPS